MDAGGTGQTANWDIRAFPQTYLEAFEFNALFTSFCLLRAEWFMNAVRDLVFLCFSLSSELVNRMPMDVMYYAKHVLKPQVT